MQRGILSFEEISQSTGIDDLLLLYEQRGLTFSGLEPFLERLSQDWTTEAERQRERVKSESIPDRVGSVEVHTGDVVYGIHGVTHDWMNPFGPYRKTVADTVREKNNWLFEELLGAFFRINKYGQGIPDSLSVGSKDMFGKASTAGSNFFENFAQLFRSRWVDAAQTYEQDSRNLDPRVGLSSWAGPLPAQVILDVKDHQGQEYTSVETRSAYQAEFMRVFKPGEDTNILVGLGHSPQIMYFLAHGVRDNETVELAHEHAEMLRTSPGRFRALTAYSGLRTQAIYASATAVGLCNRVFSEVRNRIKK